MSSAKEAPQKYVMGIDLGSASLGWALIALDESDNPTSLIHAGVRIFEPGVDGTSLEIQEGKDQSKAVDRRTARLHRRQLRRRAARQRDLFRLLQKHSLLPAHQEGYESPERQRHLILNDLDERLKQKWHPLAPNGDFAQLPLYFLRKRALDEALEPHEIGRVFFHLIQRRGFLSNRREGKRDQDQEKELGQVKADIHSLEQEMLDAGARTLGEYFAELNPHAQKVRRRWTARKMYKTEFDKIWEAQASHHPALLTADLHDKIAHLLFFQRPIAAQTHLIGKCELEAGKQRAPWATMEAQRFRILQKVNDLKLVNPGSLISIPLTAEERVKVYGFLDREGDQTFKAIKKHLSFPANVQFNLEKGDEKRLRGNRTQAAMRKAFGNVWDSFTPGRQRQIVENWRNSESDENLVREAVEHWGLDEVDAKLLAEQVPEDGYCAISLTALSKLLPLMQDGKPFKEAEKEIYGTRFSGGTVFDILPEVRKHLTSLRNPAVERSLTELRKVANAIVREYGKPYEIRIELARELKKPRQERVEATKKNRNRQKEREEIAARILRECGLSNPSRKDIEKALLHEECGGYCPYTGKYIPFSNLFHDSEFDVEHIIPRSRYPDDSFQNKTLCYLPENREVKKGQTPWEAYGKDEQRWAEIVARVSRWNNKGKLTRFCIQSSDELGDFGARQMNDTRYASVLASRLLETLYGGRDIANDNRNRQVVFASSGAVTATLRRSWGLEAILHELVAAEPGEFQGKPRSDHRHHAIDAIAIALTRTKVIQSMARAASSEHWQRDARAWRKIESPWPKFVDSIRPHIENLLVSHRPEHKMSGALHDETNYGNPYAVGKKTFVNIRKRVSSLSAKDIENIVDPAVRAAVSAKAEVQNGDLTRCEVKQDWPCLQTGNGNAIPIKKVRLKKVLKVTPIASGPRRRFVAESNNHHIAIFAQVESHGKEKRWEGVVVSLLEAYERKRLKQPVIQKSYQDAEEYVFKFDLMGGDTVELHKQCDHKAGRCIPEIYRLRTIAANGQLSFVKISDARLKDSIKKAKEWWSPMPDALRKLNCRKVNVLPTGKMKYLDQAGLVL